MGYVYISTMNYIRHAALNLFGICSFLVKLLQMGWVSFLLSITISWELFEYDDEGITIEVAYEGEIIYRVDKYLELCNSMCRQA